MAVGQHLDLDVARLAHVTLEEHPVVAEGGARLAPRPLERLAQVALVERDAHALAAAAGRGLDHQRVADRGGVRRRASGSRDRLGVAGHDADAGLGREALGRELVAHGPDRCGRRADEDDPAAVERLGEVGVLGEKAVARVDRVGAGPARRLDDPVDLR